jgi:hypothetical protein
MELARAAFATEEGSENAIFSYTVETDKAWNNSQSSRTDEDIFQIVLGYRIERFALILSYVVW